MVPGTFFFFALGIAALLVGSFVALGWVLSWQGALGSFCVFSIASVFPLRILAKKIRQKHGLPSGVDALKGQEAIVINFLGSADNPSSYLIEVAREHWSAKPKIYGDNFKTGDRVRVIAVEGVHLIVEKI
jgi:membrane protein implicated in regulation of membrane protease activity